MVSRTTTNNNSINYCWCYSTFPERCTINYCLFRTVAEIMFLIWKPFLRDESAKLSGFPDCTLDYALYPDGLWSDFNVQSRPGRGVGVWKEMAAFSFTQKQDFDGIWKIQLIRRLYLGRIHLRHSPGFSWSTKQQKGNVKMALIFGIYLLIYFGRVLRKEGKM